MKRAVCILSGIILSFASQLFQVRHISGWTENPVQVRTFIGTSDAPVMLLPESSDEDNPGEIENRFLEVCPGEEFFQNIENDPRLGFTMNFLTDPLHIDRPPPEAV